jgi:hypothetical protein
VSKWVAVQSAFKGPGSSREKLAAGSSSPAGGSAFRVASRASSSSGVLPDIPTQCILSPVNRCSSEKSSESVAHSKAPDEEVDRWKLVGSAQKGPEMEVGSILEGFAPVGSPVCSASAPVLVPQVTEASPVPVSTPVLGCIGGEVGPELGKELANVPDGFSACGARVVPSSSVESLRLGSMLFPPRLQSEWSLGTAMFWASLVGDLFPAAGWAVVSVLWAPLRCFAVRVISLQQGLSPHLGLCR